MSATASIFLDVNLPNPPTWFYFSGLLAVALFFKFSRLLSVRNLDVLSLFLPVPGFLLLVEGGANYFYGYLWLLGSCLYFLVRCLIDLALVRRPALGPNLDLGGLMWLAGALFVSLVALAARQPSRPAPEPSSPPPIDEVPRLSKQAIKPHAPAGLDDDDLRLWVERGLAVLCHLSVVVGLVLIGWRHFADLPSGAAAATFYLLLPYTYLLLPVALPGLGAWDHAWPMALMVWAVFTYRKPTLAGAFLGAAAGTAIFPVLALPAWLSFYWRRGAAHFGVGFALAAGLCLLALGLVLWVHGELPSSLRSAWTQSDWQPWKHPDPKARGFWQDIPSERVRTQPAYRMPVFLASLTLVGLTALWPAPKNLAHVVALTAAVLISIQFWYADRGGVYVLWYLPFLLLLVFRPNLVASQPPAPPPDGWLPRLGRRLRGLLPRRRGQPRPAAPVG